MKFFIKKKTENGQMKRIWIQEHGSKDGSKERERERERDLKKLKVKQAPRTHSHSYGWLTAAAAAAAISLPVTASFLFSQRPTKMGK